MKSIFRRMIMMPIQVLKKNPVRLLVGLAESPTALCQMVAGPSFTFSVRWVEELQMLCRQGKGRGHSLFADFGLSAAVELFTNCKGTTVPYFFISLSMYVFISTTVSLCTIVLPVFIPFPPQSFGL